MRSRWVRTVVVAATGALLLGILSNPAGGQSPTPTDLDGVIEKQDIPFADVGGTTLYLDAYSPPIPGPHPAVIAIHGGKFTRGYRGYMRQTCISFAHHGYVCMTVDYRLAPEFQPVPGEEQERLRIDMPGYPAQVDDVKSAIEFVRRNAERFDVDPVRIGTLGTSAGGTLSLMVGAESHGDHSKGWQVAGAASWSGGVAFSVLVEQISSSLEPLEPNAPTLPTYIFGQAAADPEGSDDGDPKVSDMKEIRRADPYTKVRGDSAALFVANSSDENVPVELPELFGQKLDEVGVPHRVEIFPGGRHALGLLDLAFTPTLKFFDQYVRGFDPANPPTPEPKEPGSSATPSASASPPEPDSAGSAFPMFPLVVAGGAVIVGGLIGVPLLRRRRHSRLRRRRSRSRSRRHRYRYR